MGEPDLHEALRAALGAEAVDVHDPRVVDGVWVEVGVRPADGPALAEALRVLSARRARAVVCGGGSRLSLGNPPRGAAVWLGVARLAGVDELDLEEGVAHVRAGTPLGELTRALEGTGWEAPFDPPGEGATLGGTLATAVAGPRRVSFGLVRDRVLGLEVTLGDGERTRCGGRVVKNVTGYDLMKLQIGALGTLGVLEGAWIRLLSAPEGMCVLAGEVAERETALEQGLAAARLASARAVALLSPGRAAALGSDWGAGRGYTLVAELGGDARTVEGDAARLSGILGPVEGTPALVEGVRRLQGTTGDEGAPGFRLTVRPSRLAGVVGRLEEGGGELLVYPGDGTVYARFALGDGPEEEAAEGAWRAAREAARAGAGSAVLEAGPSAAKRGRDVFGEAPSHLPLLRVVKARFDPAGVLNPGRFVGGI